MVSAAGPVHVGRRRDRQRDRSRTSPPGCPFPGGGGASAPVADDEPNPVPRARSSRHVWVNECRRWCRPGYRCRAMTDTTTFQVDLRGVVDLLSHHLYGSPRVYVRELLQNAVDAITARRIRSTRRHPRRSTFASSDRTGDGTLRVTTAGIGLTEDQVHELLATIGRSSKRDDLGFARHEFLGQFGIGMLSCFLVADEIQVLTRAGDGPTVAWTGFADGRYAVTLPAEQRAETGTTVTLRAAPWHRALAGRFDGHRAGPSLRLDAAGRGHGRRRADDQR